MFNSNGYVQMNTQQRYVAAASPAIFGEPMAQDPHSILVEVGLHIQRPENEPDQYGSSEIEVLFSALKHYEEYLHELRGSQSEGVTIEIMQVRDLQRNAFMAVRDRLALTADVLDINRR